MRSRLCAFVAALCCLLGGPPAARAQAGAVQVEASVSPRAGTTDDRYQLTVQIRVSGIGGYDRYVAPDLSDFVVVDAPTFQQAWIANGAIGIQEIHTYTLVPRTDGRLRIGEATVFVGGAPYKTRPLFVTITRGAGALPSAPRSSMLPPAAGALPAVPGAGGPATGEAPSVLLRAVADRARVTVGQQVTITWRLYTTVDVLTPNIVTAPTCTGFFTQDLAIPSRPTWGEERLDGQDYLSAVVMKRAIFPLSPGAATVGPMEMDVQTLGASLFGPDTVRVASTAVPITVDPLPAGAPAGFDPANVGSMDLAVETDPPPGQDGTLAAAVGQAINVTVALRGAGNLSGMTPPAFGDVDGFKVYEDRVDPPKLDPGAGDLVQGEKAAHWIFVPQRPGRNLVPGLAFAFYDPDARRYGVAHSQPIAVVASGSAIAGGAAGAGGGAGPGENVLGPGIRPIHNLSSLHSVLAFRLYRGRFFSLLVAAPIALYFLLILADWVRERMQRETERARLRRARGRARRRLRLAELHIRGNRPAGFFGEIARVLSDHLEDRLNEPVAGMTREQLRAHLTVRGFPAELVEALTRELENCDFARFAPSASGPGEMRAALRRARALLGAIERVRPQPQDAKLRTKEATA